MEWGESGVLPATALSLSITAMELIQNLQSFCDSSITIDIHAYNKQHLI